MINLIASLQIPKGSGLASLIYGLLRWIYNGVGNYGLAIILFTIVLRLIVSPMDFGNKYFTKKNTAKLAEFKSEDAELKKQYGSDPMKYMTARREMYRRNGYNPAGMTLFMLANMILTLFIFVTVFSCLNTISSTNLKRQYRELGNVYIQCAQDGTIDNDIETFRVQLNETYSEYNAPFLWVHNIFRPDTWAQKYPTYSEFKSSTGELALPLADGATAQEREDYRKLMYDTIKANLNKEHKDGWNGYFILIVAAAVTMYFSTKVNMAAQKQQKDDESKKEIEVGYSLRKVKESQSPSDIPQINPEQMQKVMKFMLPAVMVIVTFSSNAAFALYISAGAIVQTTMGIAINFVVGKILKKQEAARNRNKPDHPIINPHSRYFKKQYE